MEVIRITPRGYCHGVVDALRIARKEGSSAATTGEPVAMLGYLVHNEHATRELEEAGVTLVPESDRQAGLGRIDDGTVIITAHGASPAIIAKAKAKGLRVVDATCSDVTRTHLLVERLAADGYQIIYIGKRGHPEPEGALGHAPDVTHLIETREEVETLFFDKGTKLAVTCQTTLSMWDTQDIMDALVERFPQIEVHNEICKATQERQEAAVAAAKSVDLVVVVGSTRSSNSLRLVQVVEELAGTKAILVGSVDELDPQVFVGIDRVGVTSGASTPTHITRAVIEALEALAVASKSPSGAPTT